MMKRIIALASMSILTAGILSARDQYDELMVKRVTAPAIGTCTQNVNFTGTIQRKGSDILKNNYSATVAPTANDDANDGYSPGSMWLNNTTSTLYACTDNTVAAAVWSDITSAVGNALTSTAVITDNTIIRGDGDARVCQDCNITIDDSDNVSGVLSFTLTGDVVFPEKADHTSTPGAGYGYLWVKNTSPTTIIFTDDTGADTTLSSGSGDVSKVGTPANDQVGVWTGDGTLEGTANFTYDGSNIQFTGDLGSTGTRITKGWFTNLECTNDITVGGTALGSIYVHLDGSQALTNDWDAGAHEIRAETFESDVTTGTAPFTIASTTVVSNLNCDQVDGKDSTDLLLVDGSQALSGDWDAGSHKITAEQLESDVTTGTAPLVVASTTVVANLNADQVDGKESTALVLVDGSQTLTSDWDAGSHKITAEQLESDVTTGTAPLIVASTTVVSNLNADQVDGKDSTDLCLLDGSQNLTAAWDAGNYAISALVTVTAHTGTGNITAAECRGGVTTNTGASGGITITLPDAQIGMAIIVVLTVAQDVDIDVQAGEQILVLTDAAGDAISSDSTIGSSVTLIAISATQWMPVGQNGTWTDVN